MYDFASGSCFCGKTARPSELLEAVCDIVLDSSDRKKRFIYMQHRILHLGQNKRKLSSLRSILSITWMTLRTAVNFDFAPNVRGVEILRHGAGLLCESCQAMIEANPRFLHK